MSNAPLSDEQLRASVGDSLNIYQATVAMGSIFLGFVFAALVQLLASEGGLLQGTRWAVRVLVLALLMLLISLILFHRTANETVRYWKIFFPDSRARRIAAVLFQLGMIAMLMVLALLLLAKAELVMAALVTFIAVLMVLPMFGSGSMHRGGSYVRKVD